MTNMPKLPAACKILLALILSVSTSHSLFSQSQPALGTTSFATSSTVLLAAVGECTGGKSGESAGYRFTLFSAANCAINNATGSGSDGHINLITTPLVTGLWQEGRIASVNGSEFQLDGFVFSVLTTPFVGLQLNVTGYRNNVAVPGATALTPVITAISLANAVTVNVTANPAFDNIDEFRLTPSAPTAQGTVNIQSISISAAQTVLPVSFTSLRATTTASGSTVYFTTESEINVADYEIQLSANGTDFTTIQRLVAENQARNQYQLLLPGDHRNKWLRLQSNDRDGSKQFSGIIYLRGEAAQALITYPNPARDILYVEQREGQSFKISGIQGAKLLGGQIKNGQVNVQSLASGMYILTINDIESIKFYKR
ncbi:MAG: T9SS type A sorting domain-containing protein [Chitinophagaceae bacterium]|nr:MAG: T9SS type A sorting domain-containing protein [Chitinophagaceae bacterium]